MENGVAGLFDEGGIFANEKGYDSIIIAPPLLRPCHQSTCKKFCLQRHVFHFLHDLSFLLLKSYTQLQQYLH